MGWLLKIIFPRYGDLVLYVSVIRQKVRTNYGFFCQCCDSEKTEYDVQHGKKKLATSVHSVFLVIFSIKRIAKLFLGEWWHKPQEQVNQDIKYRKLNILIVPADPIEHREMKCAKQGTCGIHSKKCYHKCCDQLQQCNKKRGIRPHFWHSHC